MTMDGISVNGVPLKEVVKVEEEREAITEVQEDIQNVVEEVRKSIYKATPPPKLPTNFGHSRVKQLTEDQVRIEYGVTSKPLGTMLENLLFLLKTKGPLRGITLIKELNLDPRKSSGWVSSSLLRASQWCPNYLFKDEQGFWHFEDIEISQFTKLVKSCAQAARKTKSAKKKEEAILEPLKSNVMDTIKTLLEKELNLKVQVSGEIKITFGFEK